MGVRASPSVDEMEVELCLARLESLMERRPLLLNSVLLRQNPHNVSDWLHRVELLEPQGARKQIEAFMESISSVDPGEYDHSTQKARVKWRNHLTYA